MKIAGTQRGFTLIELVMVIAILGILAAVALPKFQDLSGAAKQASTRGGLGAVRSALAIRYAMSATSGSAASYPTDLGTADFSDGQVPINALNNIRAVTTVSATQAGTQTSGSAGYWYIAGSGTASGRAGAFSGDGVDTSAF